MSTPLNVKQIRGVGQTVRVPLDQVRFSQTSVDPDKVDRMAKNWSNDMPAPIAAVVNGTYIIEDGHHRVAAAMKRGMKSLNVEVH